MPRLGASRQGNHQLGSGIREQRTAASHTSPMYATASRSPIQTARAGVTHTATIGSAAIRQALLNARVSETVSGPITCVGGDSSGSAVSAITTAASKTTAVSRTGVSHADAVETEAARGRLSYIRTVNTHAPLLGSAAVRQALAKLRTSTTLIPRPDQQTGRFGNERLGDARLGGRGVSGGLLTNAKRIVNILRPSDSYLSPAVIDVSAPRTASSYAQAIYSDTDVEIPFWLVDGLQLRKLVSETRTWDSFTLEFRSDKDLVLNRLRPLDSDAGKIELLDRSDCGFVAVDRVDGSNMYEMTPPTTRVPPRITSTFLVDEYDEEIVDQQGNEYRVTVNLVPDEDRDTNSGYVETAGSGEWEFDCHTGTIATRRVHSEVGTTGGSGTESKRLSLILDAEEVQVLEESASFLNAVRTRDVPDGENVSEDNSPDDRNTVSVSSPDDDVLESGDYVVQEWTTEMRNDRFYRVSVTLEPSGYAASDGSQRVLIWFSCRWVFSGDAAT